jgi:HEAT repeat protein
LVSGRAAAEKAALQNEPFDIWAGYPPEAQIPVDLLNEDDRAELLDHPIESVRLAAASSFFNRDLTAAQRKRLLDRAQHDASPAVRAEAWQALTSATEETEVVEAMLAALRRSDAPVVERGGLLVGLAPEADRNEVRAAITELYKLPEGRAKALEAMWRSVHPSFRDHFAKHLNDPDVEVRRAAVWGVGYYGLRSELDKVRKLFEDEELRSDALFAYALAVPGEVSRGRMKGLLTRIERDARGLSELEEDLVKAALDERLMLAGKEPFFAQEED